MSTNRLIIVAFFVGFALSSCQCGSTSKGKEEAAVYEEDGTRVNKTLGLITPEQFVGNVGAALGYANKYVIDDILRGKAVALGGIDYRGAQHRNRVPSGQSALTIRNLAWQIAHEVVERDSVARIKEEDPVVFLIANVGVDRPLVPDDIRLPPEVQMALAEGDKRYREQLEEIYWRLLSRPATDGETQTMTELFTTAIENENDARAGWTAILYVLLASMEYWNI